MANEGDLRVWYIINPPSEPIHISVKNPQQGYDVIQAHAQLQLENPLIECNAFGLEVFEEGEWSEWYNDMGEDVTEAFE